MQTCMIRQATCTTTGRCFTAALHRRQQPAPRAAAMPLGKTPRAPAHYRRVCRRRAALHHGLVPLSSTALMLASNIATEFC